MKIVWFAAYLAAVIGLPAIGGFLAGRLTSWRIFLPTLAIAAVAFVTGAYFNRGWLPIEFGALFAAGAFFPALFGALLGSSVRQKRDS